MRKLNFDPYMLTFIEPLHAYVAVYFLTQRRKGARTQGKAKFGEENEFNGRS